MPESSNSILLVEDDPELAALIQEYLASNHFDVSIEADGNQAVDRVKNSSFALVILDLMLPGKDGISICREIRPDYRGSVLMLTASADIVDQVVGLEVGADDYVQKPVEPRVLLARVRALLRRSASGEQPETNALSSRSRFSANGQAEMLEFGELSINLSAHSASLKQQPLELTSPEFDMLALLASRAGRIVSRDDIFMQLRNLPYDGQSRFVDITISQLRKKLGDCADDYLKTIRGKGYLFVLQNRPARNHTGQDKTTPLDNG